MCGAVSGMNVGGISEMNDITSVLVGTLSETSERTETASMISEPGTIREQAQLPTPAADMYRLMMKTVQQNSDMLHFMREDRRADRISDWERQREKDRQTALQHVSQGVLKRVPASTTGEFYSNIGLSWSTRLSTNLSASWNSYWTVGSDIPYIQLQVNKL